MSRIRIFSHCIPRNWLNGICELDKQLRSFGVPQQTTSDVTCNPSDFCQQEADCTRESTTIHPTHQLCFLRTITNRKMLGRPLSTSCVFQK